jgi:hypothetical protein
MDAVICPSGKSVPLLIFRSPAPFEKIFLFFRNQIRCISLAVPSQTEGRFAIVTDVGNGMRWTQAALLTRALTLRTEKTCGPDAPTLASSWRKTNPLMTVANKPGHRGEHGGSR